jgi:hypothetical protein
MAAGVENVIAWAAVGASDPAASTASVADKARVVRRIRFLRVNQFHLSRSLDSGVAVEVLKFE